MGCMAARPTPEPLILRYAPYIQQLSELFSTYGLHYGSPEDILTITRMLRQPGPFAGDLSLVTHSILAREGSSFSRARLLEIVALAIGGPQMDSAPLRFGPAFTELFAFLASVRARPVTQSPSPSPRQPSRLVPFPREGLTNRSAAQAAVATDADQLPLRQPQSRQPQSLRSGEVPAPQPEPVVPTAPTSRTTRTLLIAGVLLLLLAWILALLLRPHLPIQAASRPAAASVAAAGQAGPAAQAGPAPQAASAAQAGSSAQAVPPSAKPLKPSPYVYSVAPPAHRTHPATPQPAVTPAPPSQ